MKKVVCSLLIMFILFSEFTACFGATNEVVLSNDVVVNEKKTTEENVGNKTVVQNETAMVSNEIEDEEKIENTIDDEQNKMDKGSLEIDEVKDEDTTNSEENCVDEKVLNDEKSNEGSFKSEDNEVRNNENTDAVVQSIQTQSVGESEKRLVEIDGIWRMMVNGKIVYDYTGVGSNENGMWYMENGNISYKYNGTWFEGEDAYIIENSKVQIIVGKDTTRLMYINNMWRSVIKGKIDYKYTGLCENDCGYWYMENGNLPYTYYGTIYEGDTAYIIEKNFVQEIVPKDTTKMMYINYIWRAVINGKVDYHYTGLAQNGKDTWYFENGNLTYNYNGIVHIDDGDYAVEKSLVLTNVTRLKYINGIWRMVINGKIEYKYTGLCENDCGYWYMENGNLPYTYYGTIYEGDNAYIIEKNFVQKIVPKDTTRLMYINSVWRAVINGKIDYKYTGLCENDCGYWYMENGNLPYTYYGTIYEGDTAYIIEKNFVQKIVPKDTTKMMYINYIWRAVINGKVNYTYTGLAQNGKDVWYFENGNLTYNYNGIVHTNEGDYVVEKSLALTNVTRLKYINGIWRMVINGKIEYKYTGLCENDCGYWYMENGELPYTYYGTIYEGDNAYIIEKNFVQKIVPKDTTKMMYINYIWRAVINGKVNYTYTGLAQNGKDVWYFENGDLTYNYNGIVHADDGDYVIEKSLVLTNTTRLKYINGIWYMVINGKIDYNYTGLCENDCGYWYMENGNLPYTYYGTIYEGDNAYIIEKNFVQKIVPKDTTKMMYINCNWRMVIDGKIDYHYTGPAENENGRWYFENGEITYTYNSEYEDTDGIIYCIVNSRFSGIVSRPGFFGKMEVEQPVQSKKYISDSLIVSGWGLTSEVNDKILVYVDGKYVGEAKRESRQDILDKYNEEYGTMYTTVLPGFTYDFTTYGLGIGNHIIKIENVTADGSVIIQSREVEFYITALSKSYGIDVSHYQGEIDWEAVKNSGVTFAILKIGEYWTNSKKVIFDQFFERNYWACKRLGIAVGGYFYSYAFNRAEGNEEADVCLSLIKNKIFELPIFIDVEDKAIKNAVANGKTDVANVTDASLAFCEKIVSAGHQAGVYASRDFFYNYFNIPLIEKYWIWVAHYTSGQTDYTGKYNFWQATSKGSVPGINGNVDIDWFYKR